MILVHLLFAWLWLAPPPQSANLATRHTSAIRRHLNPRPPAGARSESKAGVKHGPSTPAQLQRDVAAALHAVPLAADSFQVEVQPGALVITGTVHSAESKGDATRLAREVAAKDGHAGFHVYNRTAVELPATGGNTTGTLAGH